MCEEAVFGCVQPRLDIEQVRLLIRLGRDDEPVGASEIAEAKGEVGATVLRKRTTANAQIAPVARDTLRHLERVDVELAEDKPVTSERIAIRAGSQSRRAEQHGTLGTEAVDADFPGRDEPRGTPSDLRAGNAQEHAVEVGKFESLHLERAVDGAVDALGGDREAAVWADAVKQADEAGAPGIGVSREKQCEQAEQEAHAGNSHPFYQTGGGQKACPMETYTATTGSPGRRANGVATSARMGPKEE